MKEQTIFAVDYWYEVRNFENWNCFIKSKNVMHVTSLLATFNVYIDSLNLIVKLTSLLEINKNYYIDNCFICRVWRPPDICWQSVMTTKCVSSTLMVIG